MRGWLEERVCSYVLAVTSSKSVYHEGHQRRVGKVARSLSEESWVRASAGKGTKGERLYDWACVELPESGMYREGVLVTRVCHARTSSAARRAGGLRWSDIWRKVTRMEIGYTEWGKGDFGRG